MERKFSSGDLSSTSDVRLPSGTEVESARTHVPLFVESGFIHEGRLLSDHSHDGGLKDRLYHIRNRATRSLSRARRGMSERVTSLRGTARTRVASLRSAGQAQVSRVQLQMRANPVRWAGIAAGAGLGIGILARMMRHRTGKASLPRLIVIDSTC